MPLIAATFDPIRKGAAVVVSVGNTVATVSSGTGSILSSSPIRAKCYCEMVTGATLSGTSRIGMAHSTLSLTTLVGAAVTGIGYNATGTVLVNNISAGTIATYTTNTNIGVAFNPFTQKIWFRVNGGDWNNASTATQNPATDLGGFVTTGVTNGALYFAFGATATASATYRPASSSWTYAAPSGFVSVDNDWASVNAIGSRIGGVQTGMKSPTYKSVDRYLATRVFQPGSNNRTGLANGYVTGQVRQNGVPLANVVVALYDRLTRRLINQTTTNGVGSFSLHAMGCPEVYAVALNAPYNAQIYDLLAPVQL